MKTATDFQRLRAEPYTGGGGRSPQAEKTIPVVVKFLVEADSLEQAKDKVRQVIEHGKEAHNPEIEWDWGTAR